MFIFDTDHLVIIQQATQPEFGKLAERIADVDFQKVPGLRVEDWTTAR